MSDQEAYAVESLEASLNAIIDYSYGSTVHREMDRMFNMARNKLKPRDFHDGDWKTASVNEKMAAREKWNKLFNLSENLDNEGRNRFLTRFMALTLGSEKFNQLLNKVDPVPEEIEGAATVYEYILNRFHRFIAPGSLLQSQRVFSKSKSKSKLTTTLRCTTPPFSFE